MLGMEGRSRVRCGGAPSDLEGPWLGLLGLWAEAPGCWCQGPQSRGSGSWEALRASFLDGTGTGQRQWPPPFSAFPPPYFGVSGRKFYANKSLILSVASYFCRVAHLGCSFSTFSIFKHRFCVGHESLCRVALETPSWAPAEHLPAGGRGAFFPQGASEQQDRREGTGPTHSLHPPPPGRCLPPEPRKGKPWPCASVMSETALSQGTLTLIPTPVFRGPGTSPLTPASAFGDSQDQPQVQ